MESTNNNITNIISKKIRENKNKKFLEFTNEINKEKTVNPLYCSTVKHSIYEKIYQLNKQIKSTN